MSLKLAAFGAIASLIWGVVLVLYRLYFHRLAKYPGPRLAAITDWYASIFAWRGDLHVQSRKWHDKYGDIVRYGPNSLAFNTPAGLKDIYNTRSNVVKSAGYNSLSASRRTPNILNTTDKLVHGFKRRVLTQVFSFEGIKAIEARFLANVRDFIDLLGENEDTSRSDDGWSSTKLVSELCDWLAFDIISDLCYGKDFDMLHSSEMRWFPSVVRKISQRGATNMTQPSFCGLKIDRLFMASKFKDIVNAGTWVRERAEARTALGNNIELKDAFYNMMNTADPKTGQYFTQKDLWVESMLLLAAGSDTTSSAMSGTLFYLVHNPKVLARLVHEIRTAFTAEEEIHMGRQLNSCEFLQACINESMRLVPSVANMIPRTVLKGGMTIDQEFVPEGTTVGTYIYSLQRSPKYFTAPNEWRPERWILDVQAGVDEESIKAAKAAFCPFSVGPRSCVGWKLAWTELNVTLARMLFRYDVRLAPDAPCCGGKRSDCPYPLKGWVTSAVDGPYAQFRPRT